MPIELPLQINTEESYDAVEPVYKFFNKFKQTHFGSQDCWFSSLLR